jgi:NAD(P)-dependent dehydrogenase (short-subunit alcohol dehydrogenase family)
VNRLEWRPRPRKVPFVRGIHLLTASTTTQIAITGAASGIGRATAQYLASHGALLSLSDRNVDGLRATMESLPKTSDSSKAHLTAHVDVTSESAINKWIDDTVKHFGRLDCAANVAGTVTSEPVPIRASTEEIWSKLMDITARGTFFCLRAELQQMKRGGSIVNVASIAGHVAVPGWSTYVASKHAVIGLTKVAAREEGENGIRVNCVAPGKSLVCPNQHLHRQR